MCSQSPLQCSLVPVLLLSCLCSLYSQTDAIKFEEFIGYPFGAEYGYSLFPRGVDLYEGVATTIPFPYFGQKYNFINVRKRCRIISINIFIRTCMCPCCGPFTSCADLFCCQIDDSGYIALLSVQRIVNTPFSARTTGFPFKRTTANLDWSAVVAPFWADIATGGNQSGRIYYKNFTKGEEEQATANISKLVASTIPQLRGFTPEWSLIITWDQVGYYPRHDDKVCDGWQIVLYTYIISLLYIV